MIAPITKRYFRRKENNGYWSVVPLQGPYFPDAVIINDFTNWVLDLLESGEGLDGALDRCAREHPDEDPRKIRADLFHIAGRLGKYDLVEGGGFASRLSILQPGAGLVSGSIQPCPVIHIPRLSDFIVQAVREGGLVYHVRMGQMPGGQSIDSLVSLYSADRMVEQQSTGAETYWVYVGADGQFCGAVSSSSYMQMAPVVALQAIAVTPDETGWSGRVQAMLEQIAETLSLFGLSEKIRVTSLRPVDGQEANLSIADPRLFEVLARCGFRKTAVFQREINDRYHLEYYDRIV